MDPEVGLSLIQLEPGSEAAVAEGCTCEGLENLYVDYDGQLIPIYRTDPSCPCHGVDQIRQMYNILVSLSPMPTVYDHQREAPGIFDPPWWMREFMRGLSWLAVLFMILFCLYLNL